MPKLRAATPVTLLLGWYAVALAATLGLGWAGLLAFRNDGAPASQLTGAKMGAFAFAAVAGMTGYNLVRSVVTKPSVGAVSVKLKRDRLPSLWGVIDHIAEKAGGGAAPRVLIVPEPNASMEERTVMLGLFGGTRVLRIGLPLLLCLDDEELTAVLAHEFGHYAGGHSYYTAVTYRGTDAMNRVIRSVKALIANSPEISVFLRIANSPVVGFAKFYQRTTLSTRRALELEADRFAAGVVSSDEAVVRALRRFHGLTCSWDDFSKRFLASSAELGDFPDNATAAYRNVLAGPGYLKELEAHGESALPSIEPSEESHPSLARRVEKLGAASSQQVGLLARSSAFVERDSGDLETVVADLGRVQVPIGSRLRPRRRIRAVEWDAWLATVPGQANHRDVTTLARAVREPGAPLETSGRRLLGTILGILETDGGTRRLTEQFRAVGPGLSTGVRDTHRIIAASVYTLAGRDLVTAHRAAWVIEWHCDARLSPVPETNSGTVGTALANLRELIDNALASPADARLLRQCLTDLGIDLESPDGEPLPTAIASGSKHIDPDEFLRRWRRWSRPVLVVTAISFIVISTLAEIVKPR